MVPYAAGRAMAPYIAKLAYRAKMARATAYANPYARVAAAKVIGRAARSFLSRRNVRRGKAVKKSLFSRTKIGERVGTTSAKTNVPQNTAGINQDTRTLYALDLTNLTQGTNPFNRTRSLVNMRGFRICFHVRNNAVDPLYFNFAVIAPKDDLGSAGIPTANFFRSNQGDRSVTFDTTRSGLEMHCLPINTDDYTILKHKRFILNSVNNVSNVVMSREYGATWTTFTWYIPLKRQVRYNAPEGATPTDGRVFYVYWASSVRATSGSPVAVNTITTDARVVTYFREPEH